MSLVKLSAERQESETLVRLRRVLLDIAFTYLLLQLHACRLVFYFHYLHVCHCYSVVIC
jgi:hypothetical protein